jgi:hypothetical protein
MPERPTEDQRPGRRRAGRDHASPARCAQLVVPEQVIGLVVTWCVALAVISLGLLTEDQIVGGRWRWPALPDCGATENPDTSVGAAQTGPGAAVCPMGVSLPFRQLSTPTTRPRRQRSALISRVEICGGSAEHAHMPETAPGAQSMSSDRYFLPSTGRVRGDHDG